MAASAAAFAPSTGPVQRSGTVAVNGKMSSAIPWLEVPEKLDGSMVGDVGFDPMGLSEIQADLKYARWAEIKHGRAAMLAIVGMVWQEYGPHVPGDRFAGRDPFTAVQEIGFVGNMQIFLAIGCVELANFNKHYGEGEPGDIGFGSDRLKGKDEAFIRKTREQEIAHCRLAMIAILGAGIQTHLTGKFLFDLS